MVNLMILSKFHQNVNLTFLSCRLSKLLRVFESSTLETFSLAEFLFKNFAFCLNFKRSFRSFYKFLIKTIAS